MKKFTKVSLILAGVVAVLAVMLCCASLLVGGGLKAVSEQANEAGVSEKIKTGIKNMETGSTSLTAGNETKKDNYQISAVNMEKIYVNVDMGDVEFVVSQNADEVQVEMKQGYLEYYSCKMDGTSLVVEYDTGYKKYKKGPKIIISVPNEAALKEIEAETALGDVKMDEISVKAQKVNLFTALGDVKLTNVNIPEELEAKTSLGDVKLTGGSYGKIECKNDLGDIKIESEIAGDVNAHTSMGDVKVNVTGAESDYNYELKTSMGEVRLNGKTYKKDMSGEATIHNADAAIKLTLSSSMGDVKVTTK